MKSFDSEYSPEKTASAVKTVLYGQNPLKGGNKMLGIWRSHAEYQKFVREAIALVMQVSPQTVTAFANTIQALPLGPEPRPDRLCNPVPHVGKAVEPAARDVPGLRPDVRPGESDIAKFRRTAMSSPLLCALVGVTPETFPGESTMRDFVSRLWLDGDPERVRLVEPKPKGKHGKKKQPPKNPGIIKELAERAKKGETFGDIPEAMLQRLPLLHGRHQRAPGRPGQAKSSTGVSRCRIWRRSSPPRQRIALPKPPFCVRPVCCAQVRVAAGSCTREGAGMELAPL